jgi:hypothetical protein
MDATTLVTKIITGLYVHFTTAEDAEAIVATGEVRAGTRESAYAVAVGGSSVPGVQYGGGCGVIGDEGRKAAVLFATDDMPDAIFPEEVLWRSGAVRIKDALIIEVDEAIAALDGSAGIPDTFEGLIAA